MPRHPLRVAVRLIGFLAIVAAAVLDLAVRALLGRTRDVRDRARWLHRWTGRALRWMGIAVSAAGVPPRQGVLVSNHLGYLDVFVLSSIAPTVFLSNHEVRSWPVAGWLARMAGTVFIDRRKRSDVIRVGEALAPIIAGGQPVALFLEGTSTGGDRVLPFHSSLLAPAIRAGWTLTPAFIRYLAAPGTSVAEELCFWGDARFFPHFLNLLGLPRARVEVIFGASRPAEGDRRALATSLRAEICGLGGMAG